MYFISFLIDHTSVVKFHLLFLPTYLFGCAGIFWLHHVVSSSQRVEPRRSALGAESCTELPGKSCQLL